MGDTANRIRYIPFMLLGVLCGLYCVTTVVREGLELLCLLPLSFALSVLIFNKAYSYWKDNIGLTLIFVSIIFRFLLTPAAITAAKSTLSVYNPTPESYRLGIFVSIFELIVTLTAITLLWGKHRTELKKRGVFDRGEQPATFRLTLFGFLFLLLFTFMFFQRGHSQNVFDHLSTWWSSSEATDDLFTYDMTMFNVVKTGLVLILVSFFSKRYHACRNSFREVYFLLAFAAAAANTMFYQEENRTSIVVLALSSMFLLFVFFPNKKKLVAPVFLVGCGVIVGAAVLKMNFGYREGSELAVDGNTASGVAKFLEQYFTGPTMMAETIDNYSFVRGAMTAKTYWVDFIKGVHLFDALPFLRPLYTAVAELPRTNDLFVQSLGGITSICPNYSMCTYYFGRFFGWIAEAGIIFGLIKLLCITDNKKRSLHDGGYVYALINLEMLIAQAIFMNNFYLLVHAFTYAPIWVLAFMLVNRLGEKLQLSNNGQTLPHTIERS